MPQGRDALILEDNPHMRALLSELLHGLRVGGVWMAEDLAGARAAIESRRCDFALVDIGLQGESGLDFVRALRMDRASPYRRLPILVVSGQGDRPSIEAARDSGADGFLMKPFSSGAFEQKIESLLARREPYVETDTYYGPNRRRRNDPAYKGPDRRGAYQL